MDNRSATSSTCGENPNGRAQSYASALVELDKVTAERDRLAQKLDDEPDSKKYARDLTSLIFTYYGAADSTDQRALISNLGSLLQQAGSTIDALTREVGHYAAAEADARHERDELRSALVELTPDSEWHGPAEFIEAFRAAQTGAAQTGVEELAQRIWPISHLSPRSIAAGLLTDYWITKK